MTPYRDLMIRILTQGEARQDRTGTGTLSLFATSLEVATCPSFPLLTLKKLHVKSIVNELLWFLNGHTNKQWLNDRGVKIWDGWALPNGELGPIYGKQWRAWQGDKNYFIDQITSVMASLKANPTSRRHIVSAWNVQDLPDESLSPQENVKRGKMALAPCHLLMQFYVDSAKSLHCQVYQRSVDTFLGLPFNIASYALLIHMMAQQLGYYPGKLHFSFGDTHIYLNHKKQVAEMLSRDDKPLPRLKIKRKPASIFEYTPEDFEFEGYDPHPVIRGAVSV